MVSTSIMDAIRVVKENERNASESYLDSSKYLTNPMAKELFEQLSKFERFHYEKIAALEKSLLESGNYINYEGKEFPLPPIFEVKAAKEANTKSAMQIVSEAKELELKAKEAYASLADEIPDKQGKDMFKKLSAEEHNHFLILSKAYWSLNNTGKWS